MFKKTTLKNGLRVLTIPQQSTQAVTVLVLAGTGSKYETKKINGISHLLEHLLFKGTKNRPDKIAISEPLDQVGGIYNAFTGEEYTGFFAKVDASHFDLALDIVSDIYQNSTLPEKEINREKGVIIEEINMYADHPSSYVHMLWGRVLYGDQPAGWDILGTKESVLSISRKDLAGYMQSQYVAKNTVVCIAGHIPENPASTLKEAEKYFAAIRNNKAKDKKEVVEKQLKPECMVHYKETDQTHFCLGVRGYGLLDPKKYAQEVLATILGGMMSSRLFIKVREELGAAYYISTASSSDTDTGYVVTQAGVDSSKLEQAISAILQECQSIALKGVPQKELKRAKDHLMGKLSLVLETSDAQASFYGAQEILERRVVTPDQLCAKINKVTASDIKEVAKTIFQPEKLNLALIGPFKEKSKFEKLLKFSS